MAPFRNSPEDWQRLDWEILRDGGIALYWRHEYLTEDVQWLKAHDYDIYEFECGQWQSQDAMYSDIERVLRFSDWWGPLVSEWILRNKLSPKWALRPVHSHRQRRRRDVEPWDWMMMAGSTTVIVVLALPDKFFA